MNFGLKFLLFFNFEDLIIYISYFYFLPQCFSVLSTILLIPLYRPTLNRYGQRLLWLKVIQSFSQSVSQLVSPLCLLLWHLCVHSTSISIQCWPQLRVIVNLLHWFSTLHPRFSPIFPGSLHRNDPIIKLAYSNWPIEVSPSSSFGPLLIALGQRCVWLTLHSQRNER